MLHALRVTGALLFFAVASAHAQSTQVPGPQPFPGAAQPPPSGTPAARPPEPAVAQPRPAPTTTAAPPAAPSSTAKPPVAAPAPSAVRTANDPAPPAGVPLYPTAEYIGTFDAGSGQKYVLYGAHLPYAELVAYYKTALKNGGREIFRTPMPPTYQFDLGRFNEERMAYPPSVVVRDYTWNNSPGYLHVVGTTERRYRTVIQIVAPGPTP